MSLQGHHRILFGRFNFLVEFESTQGEITAAFRSAEGLNYNVEPFSYREGGALAAQHEPGLVNFDDITLQRGVDFNNDMWNWLTQVVNMRTALPGGAGQISPRFKKNLSIYQLERDRSRVIRYRVAQAFPITFAAGDFDNDSSEPAIESVTLKIHSWYKETLGKPGNNA